MSGDLQQTRYDRLVRRVGGIIGPGSKVAEALGELFPTIDVERVPSELLALMSTGVAWGRTITTAVVGQNSRSQLFNPADSGKLITVTQLAEFTGSVDHVEHGIIDTALATLSAVARYRDSRFGLNLQPVGQLRTDTNVGATPATFRLRNPAVESLLFTDPNDVAVLSPGFGLTISAVTANTTMHISYTWRERPAERSELNF